jgi:AcrR family transcriptional regulator
MTDSVALRVPVQTRSHKTRAALVRAASAEFSKNGYALTTAKSIAERARVGTGTFYHYFPDKDAALLEICAERSAYLLGESEVIAVAPRAPGATPLEDARARLTKLVQVTLAYHRADRGLHSVISERRLCDSAMDSCVAESEREAVRRFASALLMWNHTGDREAVAFMMFSLLEGAVHAHVLSAPVLSDERFTRGLVEALLRIGMPEGELRSSHPERAARAARKAAP